MKDDSEFLVCAQTRMYVYKILFVKIELNPVKKA